MPANQTSIAATRSFAPRPWGGRALPAPRHTLGGDKKVVKGMGARM